MKTLFFKRFAMLLAAAIIQCTMAFAQSTVTHVVRQGETLQTIASRYGLSVEELKQANPATEKMVFVGMELIIPVKAVSESSNVQSAPANSYTPTNYYPMAEESKKSYSSNRSSDVKLNSTGLGYWINDLDTYGVRCLSIYESGFGFEGNGRFHFKDDFTYNIDVALAYGHTLYEEGNNTVLATLAFGPSIGIRDAYSYDDNFNVEKKTKTFCDGYVEIGLTALIKNLTISAGYYFWGAKFKFSKEYKIDGFCFSLGYNI